MSFFKNIRNLFSPAEAKKEPKAFQYIQKGEDPSLKWEVIGELGDGAFGKVYKCQHKTDATFSALKQVEIQSDDELESCAVEIEILTECKHHHVVDLFESYVFDNKLWMYIEYCDGGAVDNIMLELEKPLTEPQIKSITRQMVEGLDFLHGKKVIHRDIKAGNVLLTKDGQVKLADFGVSALNARTNQRRVSSIGTPYWMAPEVIACETDKNFPYDTKADIWSLGVTIIEFAQMEPPNHEMHPMRVLFKVQKSEPPHLDNPKKWSSNLNQFLFKCLQKTPETRLSAADLLNHSFINKPADFKPVIELISEYKADVIVEDTELDDNYKIAHNIETGSIDIAEYEEKKSLSNLSVDTLEFETPKTSGPSSPVTDTYNSMSSDDVPSTFSEISSPVNNLPSKTNNIPDLVVNDNIILTDKTVANIDITEPCTPAKEDPGDELLYQIVYAIIDDVLFSETRQPSLYSVLTDSITDLKLDEENEQPPDVIPQGYTSSESPEQSNKPNILLNGHTSNHIGESQSDLKPKYIKNDKSSSKTSQVEETKHENNRPTTVAGVVYRNKDINKKNSEVDLNPNPEVTNNKKSENKAQYRTLTKTRKFIDADGKVQVTTSSRVVMTGRENKNREDYDMRKREEQEFRRFGKEENRHFMKLEEKNKMEWATLDKQFEDEMQKLLQTFHNDIETMSKEQKFKVEKIEQTQSFERKNNAKKIKVEQEKELRSFREEQRQDMKNAKSEMEHLAKEAPKETRKDVLRKMKETREIEMVEKERLFLEEQKENFDTTLKKLADEHRSAIAEMEAEFLHHKQQILRSREQNIWVLEERKFNKKKELAEQQLNVLYHMKRSFMMQKHEKNLEYHAELNKRKQDDMLRLHALDKKELDKHLKKTSKIRQTLNKQQIKLNMHMSPDLERENAKNLMKLRSSVSKTNKLGKCSSIRNIGMNWSIITTIHLKNFRIFRMKECINLQVLRLQNYKI